MASVFELVGAGLEGAFDPSAPERRSRIATNKARQRQYEAAEERYRQPQLPSLEELENSWLNIEMLPEEMAMLVASHKPEDKAKLQNYQDLKAMFDNARRQIITGGQTTTPAPVQPTGVQAPRTQRAAPATVQRAGPSPAFSGLRPRSQAAAPTRRPANQAFVNPGAKLLPTSGQAPRKRVPSTDVTPTQSPNAIFGGSAGAGAGMALAGAVQRDVPSIRAGNAAEPEPLTQGAFEDTVRKMGNTIEARTYYDLWKDKKWPSPLLRN